MSTKFNTFNSSKYGRPFEKTRATAEDVTAERATAEGQEIDNPNSLAYFVQNQPDGSDAYANKGFVLGFQNTITDEEVNFKAFITAFNETYNCDWATEQVYGRADPIPMWKSTTRKITLAFKIPCFSVGEGYENLGRLQSLIKSLYPSYAKLGEAQTIAQSPLIRMQVMNLLSDYSNDPGLTLSEAQEWGGGHAWTYGSLGFIDNLTITHNLEVPDAGVIEFGSAADASTGIIPKVIDVNLGFTALHEHPLGWQKDGDTWRFGTAKKPSASSGASNIYDEIGFPYGVNIDGMENPTAEDLKAAQNSASGKYTEEQKKRQAQTQAEANAKARYSGLFGNALQKRDQRKVAKGIANLYGGEAMTAAQERALYTSTAASPGGVVTMDNALDIVGRGPADAGGSYDEIIDILN